MIRNKNLDLSGREKAKRKYHILLVSCIFFMSALLLFTSSCSHPGSKTAQNFTAQNSGRTPAGRSLPSSYTGSDLTTAAPSGKRISRVKKLEGFRYADCSELSGNYPDCVSVPTSIPDCFREDYTCPMEFSYLRWVNPLKTETGDGARLFQCAAWNRTEGCACPNRFDSLSMNGFIPVRDLSLMSGGGEVTKVEMLKSFFEQAHWFTTFAVVTHRKDASGVDHFSRPSCVTIAPLQFDFNSLEKQSPTGSPVVWPLSEDTQPLPTKNTASE